MQRFLAFHCVQLDSLPFHFAWLLSDPPIQSLSFREDQQQGVHKLMQMPSILTPLWLSVGQLHRVGFEVLSTL
jgi:hypothetical protein